MHPINWFLTHDMQGFFFELRNIFPSLIGAKKIHSMSKMSPNNIIINH